MNAVSGAAQRPRPGSTSPATGAADTRQIAPMPTMVPVESDPHDQGPHLGPRAVNLSR